MKTLVNQGLIPKEHGAWALLAAALIAGFAVSGAPFGTLGLLYVAGVLALFVSRPGIERTLKRGLSLEATGFAAACSIVGSAAFAAFAFYSGRWELLFWVVPLLVCAGSREWLVRWAGPRSLSAHASAVAAMAMLVPATAHALSGQLEPRAFLIGSAAFLYFYGPVYIVRAALARVHTTQAARYFAVCAAVGAAGSAAGFVSWVLVVPFAARAWESSAGVTSLPRSGPLDLKAVGWSEVGWTSLFLVCVFLLPS
jgi:hypothetical protein